MSKYGIIGAVETLLYYDLYENFGLGAPAGYFRYGDISKIMMNRIKKELNEISKQSSSIDKETVYRNFFMDLIPEYDMNKKTANHDMAIGYLIGKSFTEKSYDQCALLLLSAYKFIKDIHEPFLIADMTYFFGLLDFEDEFLVCLKKTLEFDIVWDDKFICNIGKVLCDNFKRFDLALECFFEALEINPNLPQAKQNVFIAGKYCIRDLACEESTIQTACELGEKIVRMGGNSTNHGFYSYLGLAYECSGDKVKAKYYYNKALKIDKTCYTSNEGLARINSENYNIENAKHAVQYYKTMQPVSSHQKKDLLFYSNW